MSIKKSVIFIISVLLAGLLAIASKMLLPSDVNVADFDSIFVAVLGFEIVASLYFVLIYVHNAVVTWVFGRRSDLPRIQIGLRFGICFGVMYLLGMQEVVVDASPFGVWGMDFIVYQFFMGAGEAIAAVLLCMAVATFVIGKGQTAKVKPAKAKPVLLFRDKARAIVIIAAVFTALRAIAYETGIVHSDIGRFPVPVYLWTILFGLAMGCGVILLYPVFAGQSSTLKKAVNISVLTIGLGWVIFNLFIGLIFAGAMAEILLRVGLDVVAIFIGTLFWRKPRILPP